MRDLQVWVKSIPSPHDAETVQMATDRLGQALQVAMATGALQCSRGRIIYTGELGYDRLNGTRKIGPSYTKSVVYI